MSIFLLSLLGLFSKAFFSIPAIIVLILDIMALKKIWNDAARSDMNKVVWSAVVFFFPLGGLICWWLFGESGSRRS